MTVSKTTAKHKGYIKWLITWEGYDFDPNSRCKIVTALPPQYSERSISKMLPFLFSATYGGLLGHRIHYGTTKHTSMFKNPYRDYYVELWFGWIPKEYLSARLVFNLRSEQDKRDTWNNTLYWDEYPKYRLKPNINPDDVTPANYKESMVEIIRPSQPYSYSIRDMIEAEKKWRKNRKL